MLTWSKVNLHPRLCCHLCLKVPSLSSDPLYSNYNAINPYAYKELPLLWDISYIIKFN